MLDLGYVLPGTTINIPFATYDSNDPSASVTTTGLAVTDIEVYKDGSLTQRASDTGYAVDIDFDALTGLHTIQIDLSSNATAGFFAAGSEYLVAVSSITVDAATVSLWACRFTIGIPGMVHGSNIATYTSTDNFTLTAGSSDDDAYNGCILIAYDAATQYQMQIGIVEDYTGSTKTVNLLSDPGIFTMAANDNIIIMPPSYPAGAVVSDLAAIESELILVHSETTIIASDTIVIESSVQVAESNTVVLESDSITIQSSVEVIEGATGGTAAATLVDNIWDEVITGAVHNTQNSAGRRLRELRESGFYTDGFIYIDTVNGAADSTSYEAGTEVNPTNSIANANTIASALGLNKFRITTGSTITLAASQTNQIFAGHNYDLALGGQDISGSTFIGARVDGTGTNTTGEQHFIDCEVTSTNITVPTDTHFHNCQLAGNITAGEAGNFFFDKCYSAVAGAGSVTFDFGAALNSSNLNVRHHSGGWTIANMGAGTGTYNATFEGTGAITWAASCSATSNAELRGSWKVTDNASGAVSETWDDLNSAVTIIASDSVIIESNTVVLESDSIIIESSVQAIEAAGGSLSAAQDSKLTQIHSESSVIQSDSIVIESSVQVIEAAGGSLSAAQDSKLTKVTSDVVILDSSITVIQSQTTVMESDSIIVESSVQAIEAWGNPSTPLSDIESSLVIVKSDLVVLDNAVSDVESSLVIVKSDLVISNSQTTVIESNTEAIHSQTTVIESDSIIVESSVQVAESNTVVIESDVIRMELGIITGAAVTGTLNTTTATTNLTGYADDQLIGRVLIVTSGAADGEATDITDYANASGTLTFTALTTAMGNGDTFKIV